VKKIASGFNIFDGAARNYSPYLRLRDFLLGLDGQVPSGHCGQSRVLTTPLRLDVSCALTLGCWTGTLFVRGDGGQMVPIQACAAHHKMLSSAHSKPAKTKLVGAVVSNLLCLHNAQQTQKGRAIPRTQSAGRPHKGTHRVPSPDSISCAHLIDSLAMSLSRWTSAQH
jgi:hypothetical protein